MIEEDIELDKTCQNCSYFFQDGGDWENGICMNGDVCANNVIFEPYIEEVLEGDFSNCRELYLQNRFEGIRNACEQFEEIEMMDIPEGEDIIGNIRYQELKDQDVDEVVKYLYSNDLDVVKKALSAIEMYVQIGNKEAFEGVLNYYLSLGPAESLEDVYIRMDIIKMFSRYETERRTIEAYINELERTPSNNTTRRLYTLLLERLQKCDDGIVYDLLFDLLTRKKFSYKIRKRIIDVMEYESNSHGMFPF